MSNADYSLDVRWSRFEGIICTGCVFQFQKGYNCTISLCCFFKTSGTQNSAMGIDANEYSVPYGSINISTEVECGLGRSRDGSYCGGRKGCTFFHNNFSWISVTNRRCGFSLEMSPLPQYTNGFNQVTSCIGGPMVSFYLITDNVFEKATLLNCTVPSGRGIIYLAYTFTAQCYDFIIEIAQTRSWLDPSEPRGSPKLTLNSCKILGKIQPATERVSTNDVIQVESVHIPRLRKNSYILCRQSSIMFSSKDKQQKLLHVIFHLFNLVEL